MHNYKELIFWQKSRELVKVIYNLVSEFPDDEKFGITSQIKRSVISVSSNIAEGAGRNSDKDFIRFLDIANGFLFELEAQLFLSSDLGLIQNEVLENILVRVEEIQKMIYGFKNTLRKQ